MPITLTLDDDLAALLHSAARQKGQPVVEIASCLLRTALGQPPHAPPVSTPFRIRPHQGVFAPGISFQKLNQLADELDADAFLAP
jgi:hypothetical protein